MSVIPTTRTASTNPEEERTVLPRSEKRAVQLTSKAIEER